MPKGGGIYQYVTSAETDAHWIRGLDSHHVRFHFHPK